MQEDQERPFVGNWNRNRTIHAPPNVTRAAAWVVLDQFVWERIRCPVSPNLIHSIKEGSKCLVKLHSALRSAARYNGLEILSDSGTFESHERARSHQLEVIEPVSIYRK